MPWLTRTHDGEIHCVRSKRPAEEERGDTQDKRRPWPIHPSGDTRVDDDARDAGYGHRGSEQRQLNKPCLWPAKDERNEGTGSNQNPRADEPYR